MDEAMCCAAAGQQRLSLTRATLVRQWAVQNCAGLVICLLFSLVPRLTFTGSCSTTVFYAVSSLFFSVDRSVGGRLFGGMLWIGVFLSGGLIGFGLVSLAWLARGDGVPLQGLADSSVDPATIPEISAWFYIIIMVGHAVLGALFTWTRATATGLDMALALVAQIFASMMGTFGIGFLPLLGQNWFWTGNYGSTLKSGLVVLLALVVNACFIYVRSAHDDVRRKLSECFFDLGELYSRVASDLNSVVHAGDSPSATKASKSSASSISIMRKTLDTQSSMMLSTMEPAIPGVFCTSSDDSRKFGLLIQKLQVHLGSVRSVEKITQTMVECVRRTTDVSSVPREAWKRILSCASLITSEVAALVTEMGTPLRVTSHGSWKGWKPHDIAYWDGIMGKMAETIDSVADDLHVSAINGLERALEEDLDDPLTDLRGTGVALLATLESIVDDVIGLEVVVARALGVDDVGLGTLLLTPPAARPWYRYQWLGGVVTDLYMASGVHTFSMEYRQLVGVLRSLWSRLFGTTKDASSGDQDIVARSQRRRQVNLFWKVYVGYQLSFIAVVLITWLRFANTGSYVENATGAAKWVADWYPEYFFLAVAVCSQDTVDSSVYKAILRVGLIALGGAIALAACANEALLASPWFVFWITMLVHFVASLPSTSRNGSMDFRYSLFLLGYTFNGIFVCSYGKPFSAALQVYAGKSVSTALGAIFATLISDVVMPSFVSETASEFEASLLGSYAGALTRSFNKGRDWTLSAHDGAPGELWDSRYPRLGYRSDDHAELNQFLLDATRSRLGIIKNLYSEVETKSLDKHLILLVEVTLLPLPPSLKLIFADVGRVGMFVNMSMRVLRSSFLRGSTGAFTADITGLFERMEALVAVAGEVSEAIRVVLVRTKIDDGDIADLKAKVERLQAERAALVSVCKTIGPHGRVRLDRADVRTAAWCAMLLRGCKEIGRLAKRMTERADYQSKQHAWEFGLRFASMR